MKGKNILDAGCCGMGRFAELAAGADMHGVDLSTAVEAASRNIGSRRNVSLYQADIFKPLTSRMSKPLLLSLCRLAVPLYYIRKDPKLWVLTGMVLPTSLDEDPAWRRLDTFDWYSPTYQWKHTREEVMGLQEAGLTDIRSGPFPLGVFGARSI